MLWFTKPRRIFKAKMCQTRTHLPKLFMNSSATIELNLLSNLYHFTIHYLFIQ